MSVHVDFFGGGGGEGGKLGLVLFLDLICCSFITCFGHVFSVGQFLFVCTIVVETAT